MTAYTINLDPILKRTRDLEGSELAKINESSIIRLKRTIKTYASIS